MSAKLKSRFSFWAKLLAYLRLNGLLTSIIGKKVTVFLSPRPVRRFYVLPTQSALTFNAAFETSGNSYDRNRVKVSVGYYNWYGKILPGPYPYTRAAKGFGFTFDIIAAPQDQLQETFIPVVPPSGAFYAVLIIRAIDVQDTENQDKDRSMSMITNWRLSRAAKQEVSVAALIEGRFNQLAYDHLLTQAGALSVQERCQMLETMIFLWRRPRDEQVLAVIKDAYKFIDFWYDLETWQGEGVSKEANISAEPYDLTAAPNDNTDNNGNEILHVAYDYVYEGGMKVTDWLRFAANRFTRDNKLTPMTSLHVVVDEYFIQNLALAFLLHKRSNAPIMVSLELTSKDQRLSMGPYIQFADLWAYLKTPHGQKARTFISHFIVISLEDAKNLQALGIDARNISIAP